MISISPSVLRSDPFRLLIESVKDYAIYLLGPAGNILTWNAGAERIKGYTADEIIGEHFSIFYTAEDRQEAKPDKELEVAATEGRYEVEGWRVRKDGSKVWANMATTALRDGAGALTGYARITHDLSERKRAEEELRRSENRLRSIIQATAVVVWSVDPAGAMHHCSPPWHEFTGFSEEEVRGMGWVKAVHPDDRERAEAVWERCLATLEDYQIEYRVQKANGQIVQLAVRGIPLRDEQGRVREWTGVCTDITDRMQREQTLLLRDRAIQAVSQGILITDPNQPDNPIIYASPGVERMTGYRAEEMVGRNCRFMQGAKTDPARVAEVREAIRAGRECSVEFLNYRKDGTPYWNALSVNPERDEQGRLLHFVGVQADVTGRRQLEDQLRQSQKMESVGQLAGGIAHDFNNLLTVISGYSEILLMSLPSNDPQRESIRQISEAGERAAGLTRQLLIFSRQAVVDLQVLDINGIVKDTEKLLRRMIGEDIVMTAVLDPRLSRVRADSGHIGQVLMNLCVNARDAMPEGGKLTIQTKNVELDAPYVNTHVEVQPGRYILLTVSDTGTGMTPEVNRRIFEPFFTTKDVGKGTGLGLSVVHGIVKQNNGYIGVYSELGIGTTFKVYLPVVADEVATPVDKRDPMRVGRGTETVLVVEDEDSVREIALLAFRTQGYTVLSAANGKEAMRVVDNHTGSIDLLVTDVVMPEMNGRQLAEALRPRLPEMKVLYLSGYTDDAVVRHGILQAQVAFLQKPYTPMTLLRKVRQVLDEKK